MRQVAAPNIESSDLSLSESDKLRSKVRCFEFAFPRGSIAEASKVALGACAVIKPRKLNTHHLPNAAIPSPEESAARDGRRVWGIVRYNGKAEASANSFSLPCRALLRGQCTRPSHPQETSLGRRYSRSPKQLYKHTINHTHIHPYIQTYIHAYIQIYIHTYMHTYIHTYIRACTHTYKHKYVSTYRHMHIQVQKYSQSYI